MTTTYKVTSSAELMENYLQADVLRPQEKFLALQTDAGASLLFSIDTAGEFLVTKEMPETKYGWEVDNLSDAVVTNSFPSGATCTEFAAAQEDAKEGAAATIRLAMVLNDGKEDHLFISLGNSDSDLSWTKSPQWTSCPFNAQDAAKRPLPQPKPLEIVGLLISEAADREFIAVDIARNPESPEKLVSRFQLNVDEPLNPVWVQRELPIDLEVDGYVSCIGRTARAHGIDGLYTGGSLAGSAQLIYTPLENPGSPAPPLPVPLNLPGEAVPRAMATIRNAGQTTDLYVVAGEGLYYFAAANQRKEAVGELLVSDPLLRGIRSFFASGEEGVTVWGLNGSDQVFYLAWPQGEPPWPGSRPPAVILAGTDAISPFIDRQYSANTFFAHTGEGLIKAVKSAATGIWSKQKVTLPPESIKQEALSFSSYTTRLQVTDENEQVVPEATVTVTALGATGVYIGHEYYVIGPTPIEVQTDAQGSVTIVEAVKALSATRFTAAVGGSSHEVNPMSAPFERNSKLDSVEKLKAAVITDKKGNTTPFVPAATGEGELRTIAASNEGLAEAYAGVAKRSQASLLERPLWMLRPEAPAATANDFVAENIGENSIFSDLGDLFSWLESGVEALVKVVKDAAEDVWYFVAEIAGEIYHGILDCVETVVAAVTWLYDRIKIIVEDVIKFLEFLFAWQDIVTTHRVMKNVLIRWVGAAADNLEAAKGELAKNFEELKEDINRWAEIPGFDQTGNATRKANPPLPVQNSAPAQLGVHHFEGNVGNSSGDVEPAEPAESLFEELVGLLDKEEQEMVAGVEALRTDVIERFDSLTLSEVIKKVAAIIADLALDTAENILDAVIDIFVKLADGVVDLMTETIDIPVISSLYKEISGDDLSILDAICLIAAIPATLIYKVVGGAAPFPRGDAFTEELLAADDLAAVRTVFYTRGALSAKAGEEEPVLDKTRLRVFGVVAGSFAFVGSIALAVVSSFQKAFELEEKQFEFPKVVALAGAVSNVAYVSPNLASFINAKTDKWYEKLDVAVTSVSLLKGFVAIGFATTKKAWIQKLFPAVESVINFVWNVPVIMNIVEKKDDPETNKTVLVTESVGNFAFNLGGMMEFFIFITKEKKAKVALIAIQDVLMVGYGALMLTTGIIADTE